MSFCHHGFDLTIVTLLLQVILDGPMICAIDSAGICFPVMARKTLGSGNMIKTIKDFLRNEKCLGSIPGLPTTDLQDKEQYQPGKILVFQAQ
jgi:hypothetical protein